MKSLNSLKLNIPNNNLEIYSREKIIKNIDVLADKKLIMITAPAGYGKTTTAIEIIKKMNLQFCWFSIDNSDNDPVRFLSFFINSLKNIDKNIGLKVEELLQLPKYPNFELVLDELLTDINDLNEEFVIVLDDFHKIENTLILKAVQYFLDSGIENIHIIITSREDPNINLSKLIMKNKIYEIRENDLKFDLNETKEYFENILKIPISKEGLTILFNQTEGWIAGLKLFGFSIKDESSQNRNKFIENFKGTHRHIIEYLFEEVIRHQSNEIYDFLCNTAILDSFNVEIYEYMTEKKNGQKMIQYLRKSNIFLIELDEFHNWYRYHNLFREYLLSEITEEKKGILNLKAAKWYEKNGFYIQAVKHSLKSNDSDSSIEIIEKTTDYFLQNGEISTLMNFIQKLPQQKIEKNINLKLYKAIVFFLSGKIQDASFIIMELNEQIQDEEVEKNVYGKYKLMQILFSIVSGSNDFQDLAAESKNFINKDDAFFYSLTQLAIGWSKTSSRNNKDSIENFNLAMFYGKKLDKKFIYVLSLANLTINLIELGELQKSKLYCEQGLEYLKNECKPLPLIADIIYVPLGIVYYHNNDLEIALNYIEKGLDTIEKLGFIHMYGEVKILLVMIYYNLGDIKKSVNILQELLTYAKKIDFKYLISRLETYKIYIRMVEGEIENAIEWMNDKVTKENRYNPLYVEILIKAGKLVEAKNLLLEQEKYFIKNIFKINLTKVYILLSKISYLEKDKKTSLSYLKKAVEFASVEKMYRVFFENGDFVYKIIPEIKTTAPDFIDNIIKMIPKNSEGKIEKKTVEQLIEKLSDREIEILELIKNGYSNKGVSEKLFITIGTTKWHLHNIYGKLGVNRRTQAVKRAKDLELIK